MELTIDEVYFIKTAVGGSQIKASDAPQVAVIMQKLDKKFLELQKAQEGVAKAK